MIPLKKTLISLLGAGVLFSGCHSFYHEELTHPSPAYYCEKEIFNYDMNHDGITDYIQIAECNGVKTKFLIDKDFDGEFDIKVNTKEYDEDVPHLTLILDAITYKMMKELYSEGYFRLFYPPGKMVSTFPSISEVAYSVIYKKQKSPGYEKKYYDLKDNKFKGGALDYLKGNDVDRMFFKSDNPVSVWDYVIEIASPETGIDLEIDQLRKVFFRKKGKDMILYMRTTDLGSHFLPWDLMKEKMITISYVIEDLFYFADCNMKITLYSDHGNNFDSKKHVSLKEYLEERGFDTGSSLLDSDIVLPELGTLNFGAVYTKSGLEQKVAESLAKNKSVDIVAFADTDEIKVLSERGTARILKKGNKFAYIPMTGDPLHLNEAQNYFQKQNLLDNEGFVEEAEWFKITTTAYDAYPDALKRIWDSLSGEYVANPANIIVSLKDGYCAGSSFLAFFAKVTGTHGSLHKNSTLGMFTTNYSEAPEAIRAEDILKFINKHHPKIKCEDKRKKTPSPFLKEK